MARPGPVARPGTSLQGPGAAGFGWGPAPFDRALRLTRTGRAGRGLTSQPGTTGRGWRVQPAPSPVLRNGTLDGIACAAAVCTAVGDYENTFGTGLPLAERRTGSGWRVMTMPEPHGAIYALLSGVSCTSAAACTAVGYYFNHAGTRIRPLAERWNGTRWAVEATPGLVGYTNNGLFAVSCAGPRACTAVGAAFTSSGSEVPLAEQWNGRRWAVQPTPSPAGGGQLNAVSCTTPRACTAVGFGSSANGTQTALTERWSGSRWTAPAFPDPTGSLATVLSGVSCSAARACTAVGYDAPGTASPGVTDVLVAAWGGRRWRVQPAPSPAPPPGVHSGSYLSAVSCSSVSACTAVGSYTGHDALGLALAERWNGTRWAIEHTRDRPAGGALSGVACPSPGTCAAAGSSPVQEPVSIVPGFPVPARTLAEAGHDGQWRIQATVDLPGAVADAELNSVSCVSSGVCLAVGDYLDAGGTFATLAERWNGTRWRIQPVPGPRPARDFETFLDGVSCSSAAACTAVGSYGGSTSPDRVLAERWNGRRWRAEPAPDPGARSGSDLLGVSCPSASACTAVGSTGNGGRALAERWNGRRWRVQPVPQPRGTQAELTAVSCPSARACTAVGDYSRGRGPTRMLAERWNGRRWVRQPAPSPARTTFVRPAGVSCPSSRSCTAVGSASGAGSRYRNLAERWNGRHWAVQAAPAPRGSFSAALSAVSCASARACTAAGLYLLSNGAFGPVTQTWNGHRWARPVSPIPATAFDGNLDGVSCTRPPGSCTSVGSYIALTNVTIALAVAS